jgi:hypothetical protein
VTTLRLIGVVCLLLLTLFGCREHIADNPAAIRAPSTFLWLFPDSSLATGVSKTHLHWWGECQNALIRGYLFSFRIVTPGSTPASRIDTMRYSWTTKTDSTLLFPLDTLYRRFEVVVRGVTSSFRGLP